MSSTKGKRSPLRVKRDAYRTPLWCCKALAEALGQVKGFDTVVDLGAGDMRITAEISAEKRVGIDVVSPPGGLAEVCEYRVEDYTQTDVRWIRSFRNTLFVSNPPFSHADECSGR